MNFAILIWFTLQFCKTLPSLDASDNILCCLCFRYVRREKDIAETKRELAESENVRQKQLLESTQRQLATVQAELDELCQNAASQNVTAAKHAEILKKVRTI